MDLRSLNYFIAVYETGSFSAASKQQFVAQPSISASIKQLEETLSTPLFIRYPRGVKATEAGEQLYPLAKQLVAQSRAIKNLFITKTNKIPFQLGLIKGLRVEKMSTLLKSFINHVDNMELTLVPPEDTCDARIISSDMLKPTEQFQPMWKERYRVVMPSNHPLSLHEQIHLHDLAGVPFIQRSPCSGWDRLREALQQQRVSLDIRAKIRTVEYAIGLVKAGLGCAFIPVPKDLTLMQDVVTRPLLEVNMSREIGLAYQNESEPLTTLKRIVNE